MYSYKHTGIYYSPIKLLKLYHMALIINFISDIIPLLACLKLLLRLKHSNEGGKIYKWQQEENQGLSLVEG